jgi:4-amino-4-deoxy-L-arabinose transferase-like glycosyltransferase
VFALAGVPRLVAPQAYIAHDETRYWTWASAFFMALVRGDWLGTIVGPGNPSITLFWNHALNMEVKYAVAWLGGVQSTALSAWPDFQPTATLDLLMQRRLPIVLFNTLAVVLAYRLVHRLYGGRVALLAAILLALDPFYLADSRTTRGEGLLASLVILAILFFFSYWRSKRLRDLVLSGACTGLALLTKISAVALVIWVGLVIVVFGSLEARRPERSRVRHMVTVGGLWGLVAVMVVWLLWPAMWVSPAKAMSFVLSFLSNVGVSGRDNYFFGHIYQAEPLPLYYLVVYLLRVTPLAWLGFLAALSYLGAFYLRKKHPAQHNAEAHERALLTLLILTFVAVYGIMISFGTLKRDWYLIPVFPCLDVVAAVGLVWLLDWGRSRWADRLRVHLAPRFAWASGLGLVLAVQAATILPFHPYYYVYWNPLVWGNRWAAHAIMVGWDVDLSAGAHYLNTKPHAEKLRVATRSTQGFEQIFKGETIRWVPEQPWVQADYLAVRANHLQLQKIEPGFLDYLSHLKLDHVVSLGGVDYFWVYAGPRAEYWAGPSTLAGKATLLGYSLDDPEVEAGSALTIQVYWHNEGMSDQDDLFWRLVDANGYVWAEGTALPAPAFAENARIEDRIVESSVTLMAPLGIPPGTYFLQSGVYSREREEVLGTFNLPSSGDKVLVNRAESPGLAADLSLKDKLDRVVAPELVLLGFELPNDTLLFNEKNWLTLYWQATEEIRKDYVAALQLLDTDGKEATYWLGRPLMGSYPTTNWRAGEIVRDPWALDLPADVPAGDYRLQMTVFDAETEAAVDQVSLTDVRVTERWRRLDIPEMQKAVNAGLGNKVTLLGYDLLTEPIAGGGRLRITLYWQAEEAIDTAYRVLVELIDESDTVVAQLEGVPAEGQIPTDEWHIGEVVVDRHLLEFSNLPLGAYRVTVGMYNPETGERLAASDTDRGILLEVLTIGSGDRR